MNTLKIFLLAFLLLILLSHQLKSQALYSPPNNSNVSLPIQFNWYKAAGTLQYKLTISAGFTVLFSFTTTDSTLTVYNLDPLFSMYSWNVRYFRTNDTLTTSGWTFTVGSGLTPPKLYAPPGAAYNPVKFIWSNVPGAITYNLVLAADNQFFTIVYANSTIDSFITLPYMPIGSQYFWHVRAVGASGAGPWSIVRSFTVVDSLPGLPVLIYPTNHMINLATSFNFVWSPGLGSTKSWLQVATDTSFNNKIVNDSNITNGGYSISGLNGNTQYWWRVRGINQNGMGPWSIVFTFSTGLNIPQPPALYNPPNGSGVNNPVKLIWYKSLGATIYNYQVALDQSFTYSFISDTTVDSFKTLPGNLPSGIYYWRIRAGNTSGYGAFSNVWHFTVLLSSKKENELIPSSFKLYDCYPNPFNPTTTVRIDIPKECEGKLVLYDILGSEIKTLLDEKLNAGTHYVTLTNHQLTSGVYLLRFESSLFTDSKKIIVVK